MELGQFDYAPKTTYSKDSLLASFISGQPSLVSEKSLGTRLRPTMQVFYMWTGKEAMSLVCRQANEDIFSTWVNSVQYQKLADVFTKLHVSDSRFSV